MNKPGNLPVHIGLILDGNRRWAKARGKDSLEGHKQGAESLKEIALAAFDRGVKVLSAYVFSTENWSRTEQEVGYLMKLVIKSTERYLKTFKDAGIRVVILGQRKGLKPSVLKSIEKTEFETRMNQKGTLALCFNYGGQQEIVDATKSLIIEGADASKLTVKDFAKRLYMPEIPPVDLIVRTSGEKRTSGFMLWRSAYSELIFVDKYWPDFNKSDLDKVLQEFSARQRRFGA